MVRPEFVITECVDPDDNRILEAAVEGRADCIVTGDNHLLRLREFRGIPILTAHDFLLRLESEA
jgi:predicted nucleic acid-binding protein